MFVYNFFSKSLFFLGPKNKKVKQVNSLALCFNDLKAAFAFMALLRAYLLTLGTALDSAGSDYNLINN